MGPIAKAVVAAVTAGNDERWAMTWAHQVEPNYSYLTPIPKGQIRAAIFAATEPDACRTDYRDALAFRGLSRHPDLPRAWGCA